MNGLISFLITIWLPFYTLHLIQIPHEFVWWGIPTICSVVVIWLILWALLTGFFNVLSK